jgi:branched-chain amino acid transport system ATP-binding protein
MSDAPLLTLNEVSKSFGGLLAVDHVSLDLHRGPIYGLIGPNGAGKTTLFNLMTGVYPCTEGSIRLEEVELSRLNPHRISRMGFARTFQTIRLFQNLSTLEHVLVGQNFPRGRQIWGFFPWLGRGEGDPREEVEEILMLLGLWEVRHRKATTLPYGTQRKVEIARALALRPKILLLDEPTAGLNIHETEELLGTLNRIHELGITMMIIEHDMRLIMALCDHIFVLNFGRKIAEGSPDEIRNDVQVVEAYLGRGD